MKKITLELTNEEYKALERLAKQILSVMNPIETKPKKWIHRDQCHLVRPNFVKLRGKSSGLPLKNIFGNKFPIKLSNFIKRKFVENLWTSMYFGGII